MSSMQLAISPIGWTNDDMPELGKENTFEQSISEAALSGFSGVEIGGQFPATANEIQKHLQLRNLHVASKWFGSFLCTKEFYKVAEAFENELKLLKHVGADRVNVCEMSYCLFTTKKSMFTEKPHMTEDEWDRLIDGLNRLGDIANDYSITLCYHHHMATVIESIAETERLLNATDANKVSLCFDTGHFAFAGEDPIEAAQKFKNRTNHIHLKDIRKIKMNEAIEGGFWFRKAVLHNCFTIPGQGYLDFEKILNVFVHNHYQGWLVVEAEQDPALHNPLRAAKSANHYITSVLNNLQIEMEQLENGAKTKSTN